MGCRKTTSFCGRLAEYKRRSGKGEGKKRRKEKKRERKGGKEDSGDEEEEESSRRREERVGAEGSEKGEGRRPWTDDATGRKKEDGNGRYGENLSCLVWCVCVENFVAGCGVGNGATEWSSEGRPQAWGCPARSRR